MKITKIEKFKEADVLEQRHVDFLSNVLKVNSPAPGKISLSPQRLIEVGRPLTASTAQKLNSIVDLRTNTLARGVIGVPQPGPCAGCPNCTQWDDSFGNTWHSC